MFEETEGTCPICSGALNGAGIAQLCFGCILWWAKKTLNCSLCTTLVATVRFSVWGEDDCLEHAIIILALPSSASRCAGIIPRHLSKDNLRAPCRSLCPLCRGRPSWESRELWGDCPGLLWVASCLRSAQSFSSPLCCPGCAASCRQWWAAMAAENFILQGLCLYGLDREALVLHRMQPTLQEDTVLVVHGLISPIECQCSKGTSGNFCTSALPARRMSDLQPATTPTPLRQRLLLPSWPPPAALQASGCRKHPQLLLSLQSRSSLWRSQGRYSTSRISWVLVQIK